MLRSGSAFLAGHCCIHSLVVLPALQPIALALSALLLLAVWLMALRSRLKSSWIPALLIAFALGLGWAWVNAAARLADDLPAALDRKSVV